MTPTQRTYLHIAKELEDPQPGDAELEERREIDSFETEQLMKHGSAFQEQQDNIEFAIKHTNYLI